MSPNQANTATTTAQTQYKPYKIGSGSNAVIVSLCGAPAIDASVAAKGTALRYVLNTLQAHVALFSLSDLAAPLHSILPTPIHAAEIEAASFGTQLYSALVTPTSATQMDGIAVYNGKGDPVSIVFNVADRKSGNRAMKYIQVKSTVKLHSIDNRFSPTETASVTFCLELPQNIPSVLAPTELFPDGTPIRSANNPNAGDAGILIPRSMSKAAGTAVATSHDTTYTGTMDFLEDCDTFKAVFTGQPKLYKLVKKDFVPFTANEQFQPDIRPHVWKVFNDILWLDYVDIDPAIGITPAVTARCLRAIKCINWNPLLRKSTFLTPDEVMTQYLALTPLLSPHDTSTWGFHLFTLFFDAMTVEVREALEDTRGPYYFSPPNLSTIKTTKDQMLHLREVRKLASLAHAFNSAQDARIRRITKPFPNQQQAAAHPVTAFVGTGHEPIQPAVEVPAPATLTVGAASAFISPAETTMTRYQPSSTEYPVDPTTQFTSKYLRGFPGCFGCGSTGHRFTTCPQRSESLVKSAFHKNYLAHFPDRRKRNDDGTMLQAQQGPSQIPRLFVAVGVSFVTKSRSSEARPMPIQVNNNLPTAYFRLASANLEPCIDLGCLIDTCAGLNSGSLDFHIHIRDTYPQCVVAFEQFDDVNPFQPVKLGGAITSQYDEADHGRLTAVITYRTDIINPMTGQPMTIKFALGSDVSVNSLFGAPTLRDLNAVVDIGNSILLLRRVQRTFPLTWSEPKHGVPTVTKPAQCDNRFEVVAKEQAALVRVNACSITLSSMRAVDNRPAWLTSARKIRFELPPIVPGNTPVPPETTQIVISQQADSYDVSPCVQAPIDEPPPGSPKISEAALIITADISAPPAVTSPATTSVVAYQTRYQTALDTSTRSGSNAMCLLSNTAHNFQFGSSIGPAESLRAASPPNGNPGWDFQ